MNEYLEHDFDVVVFGAANMDMTLYVPSIPGPDEEVFATSCKKYPGGNARNIAERLGYLGMNTGIICKIGLDENGDMLLSTLKEAGVDTSGIIQADGNTGQAIIAVGEREGKRRSIIVDPGVNDTIGYTEEIRDYASRSRYLILTSFACWNSKESFETQKRLVKELGDKEVVFDPGMLYAEMGLEPLKDILERTKIFLPSEKEIEILTKKGEGYYREAAKMMFKTFPDMEIIVVKRGINGCYVTDGKYDFHKPIALNLKQFDTTGAGDTFDAGLVSAHSKGMDLETCIDTASIMASLSVQYEGATGGRLTEDILSRYIKI